MPDAALGYCQNIPIQLLDLHEFEQTHRVLHKVQEVPRIQILYDFKVLGQEANMVGCGVVPGRNEAGNGMRLVKEIAIYWHQGRKMMENFG